MDDLISRQAAIDALKKDMASLDHIIKGMSAMDVRLDAYVSQRNQVNYDIYTINNLPPAQLSTNLAEVGTDCISRQAAKSKKVYSHERHEYVVPVAELDWLPSAQPEIIRCKDCKFWTNIKRTNRYWCKTDDGLYDLNPSPNDFCSRAERRTDGSDQQTGGD